jgi:vacuolar-type H+-ATPase subunit H
MEDGSRPAPGSGEQAGELERLIAAEARLDARVQQAAAEARSLVASARARLEEAEQRSQEEFKQAIAELEGEMEQEGARQLRAIAEELDRDLVFLQAVTTERITELAAHALDRLLRPRTPDRRP